MYGNGGGGGVVAVDNDSCIRFDVNAVVVVVVVLGIADNDTFVCEGLVAVVAVVFGSVIFFPLISRRNWNLDRCS